MPKDSSNVRKLPRKLTVHEEFVEEALALGATRAKVIPTKTIDLGHWIKLQCQYGCPHYGTCFTCPPYSPTSEEMAETLIDYQKALLIHGAEEIDLRDLVVNLEGSFKKKGYGKAFALCSRPCDLCEECTIETHCKYPEKARPTMRACGINVQQTAFNNGWGDLQTSLPCPQEKNIGMILLD